MSWLTKEFLANTQAKSGTSPLGPFAAFLPNQARNMPQQNAAQPFDLQGFGREQLAAQKDHMKMLVDAIAKPRGVRRLGIDGRPEDPNRKTGLDGFYQMNPHLARSTENPTSAADFNRRVYGEGGRWGGMDKQRYDEGKSPWADAVQGRQMLQEQRNAANPMSRYGTGSVQMGQQGQGGSTVVNGVQTPLASFLLGAGRAQQKGQTSGNYQTQLTPEELKAMLMNPAFGKRM